MGTWALSDFREELATVFSGRGIANPQYDRWINSAKREVESAIQIENLKKCYILTTAADQREYNIATGLLSIVSVIDITTGKALIRSDVENIGIRDRDTNGKPVYWARSGTRMILAPTPDGIYEIETTIIVETADLSAVTDRTEIPAAYDNAIFQLAAHNGWMTLGETEPAKIWFDRYLNYMRTRMQDEDWEGTSVSEPVRVVNRLSDLRSR